MERHRPQIAVVIPCFNQAHFLAEAIESVFNQTYRDYEIIVVDDGSTDRTFEVAARYPQVHCIRQENQGPSAARNAGLRASESTFVVFLDSDDCLLPDALRIGAESLIAHPQCAFVYGRLKPIAADGSSLPARPQRPVAKDHCEELLREDFIWTPGTVMYRRSAVEKVDGFDSRIDGCEDCDLNIRITRDHPVHGHGQVVLANRHHGASMSRNSGLMLKTALTALDYQSRFVKGHRQLEDACRIGRKKTKDYFGRRLVTELRGDIKSGEWTRAGAEALTLLRYYPVGLFRIPRNANIRGVGPSLVCLPTRLISTVADRFMKQNTKPVGDALQRNGHTRSATTSLPPDGRRRTVMEHARGLRRVDVRELWEYRSLIVTLVARHVQVRYAQSVLGIGWSLLKPLISMIVFTVVFQRFVRIPSDGRPYPVFSLAALVPWTYFATALVGVSESLTSSGSMITKVYFPRLALPISFVAAPLVDLAIGLALLLLMLIWYGITPSVSSLVIIPLLIIAMMLTATGVGCIVTALDIQYRDLKQLVPFLLQVWMYASPVVYPMSMVPQSYRPVYDLNPMAGIIAAFRSVLLGTDAGDWHSVGRALATSSLVCAAGVVFFRYREPVFADVV